MKSNLAFAVAVPVASLLTAAMLFACGGGGSSESTATTAVSTSSTTTTTTSTTSTTAGTTASSFKGEVWADNWFQLYVDNAVVATDSVPITTTKSFNSEVFTFSASYPFDLNFIIKDYKEDDSGLEYIGTPQQQIGDGGFIAQITDTSSGKVVALSGAAWKCKVIHKAPLNKTCVKDANPISTCLSSISVEPTGWKDKGFDTSSWENATEYTAAAVGVKDGYFNITWASAAKLIWTSDLQADNTLLCKTTVTGN